MGVIPIRVVAPRALTCQPHAKRSHAQSLGFNLHREKASLVTTPGMMWAVLLLAGVGAAAALAVRAVAARRSPWPALLAVWAALAVAGYFAAGRPTAAKSGLVAATLALPIAVAGLAARAELRGGRSTRRAGGVAFALGAVVAALTPVVQLFLLCALAGDCL